jgi:hypothetical protein
MWIDSAGTDSAASLNLRRVTSAQHGARVSG